MKHFLYDVALAATAGVILLLVAPFTCALTDKMVDKLEAKIEKS